MGEWTGDQRDGMGDHNLFFPSPSGLNRGRDVRVLENLIYIPSLKVVGSLDGTKILFFLIMHRSPRANKVSFFGSGF